MMVIVRVVRFLGWLRLGREGGCGGEESSLSFYIQDGPHRHMVSELHQYEQVLIK